MDVSLKTVEGNFNFRAAGILIQENKLLVMRNECTPCYILPGGRVAMNETGADTIKREIREELRIEIRVVRLLWVVENFFTARPNGGSRHELGLYYLLSPVNGHILDKRSEFTIDEKGRENSFYWKPLDQVGNLHLHPVCVRDRILRLPDGVEHIVEKNKAASL